MEESPWEALASNDTERSARLTEVVRAFYARVVPDPMIGFLFVGKDIERLIKLEVQFTAAMLGGPQGYEGRGMRQAHAKTHVFGGHFERRQQLLREVMQAQGLAPQVQSAWLSHNEALRSKVTHYAGSDCDLPIPPKTETSE